MAEVSRVVHDIRNAALESLYEAVLPVSGNGELAHARAVQAATAITALEYLNTFEFIDATGCPESCPFLNGDVEMEVTVDGDGDASVDLICAECAAERAWSDPSDSLTSIMGQAKAGPYPVSPYAYGKPPIFFVSYVMEN